MSERRQLPRWQVKRQARLWLPQMQEFSQCIIEDINLKGMRATLNIRIPQEQSVKMSLNLEDHFESMKLEVDLPWVREDEGKYVYGMTFSKIMESDKDRISQYIDRHCWEQLRDRWWGVENYI